MTTTTTTTTQVDRGSTATTRVLQEGPTSS